jgi:hypothetical protein
MKFNSIFSAITSLLPSIMQQQASSAPLDPNKPGTMSYVRTDNKVSCVVEPPSAKVSRTSFNFSGCTVYGYPSSGGILVKNNADIVDLDFLSLPRNRAVKRSFDTAEEDDFCKRLQHIGATWWKYDAEWLDNFEHHGGYFITEEQKKIIIFGWPADGVGVWVLRYKQREDAPDDLGLVKMAKSMEERIEAMEKFGAEFVMDVARIEELQPGYPHHH